MNPTTESAAKEAWVTPAIDKLGVNSTKFRDMRGGDNSVFVDCTRS